MSDRPIRPAIRWRRPAPAGAPAGGRGPAGRGPRGPRGDRRDGPPLPLIGAALAALILVIVLLNSCGGDDEKPSRAQRPADPSSTTALGREALRVLRPDPARNGADLTRRAQAGFANPLYRLVPGGALLTAARVATYRPLIEDVAKRADEDPNLLEAIVYLESAGRPDAMASDDVEGAAGFTQIVAGTGSDLLGMKIDVARSKRLTRLIRRGGRKRAAREAERRRVDPRFDPRAALEATTRYLDIARKRLGGRDDLAVASYHMGIGNLQEVLRAFGRGNLPYVELYFGIDPLRTPEAARIMAGFSDDSSSYLWRIGAAERLMRQFRHDPAALRRETALQVRKASSEDVLHPPGRTPVFADPAALARAERDGALRPLPEPTLRANGLTISSAMGELAGRLDQPRTRYRALRPAALGGLLTIGAAVVALDRERGSRNRLIVTSTVRDARYQSLLGRENVQATDALSQHTTGWAVDIARQYRGGDDQARNFQWVLTRLQALNLIAWVREPQAIHVTFSDAVARELRPVLEKALGR
ncbi:DUF5715 family protein [Patulibacter defluvii]|uniref:DUF5715 family protein n=1 Tax=Patulibacter defluvii TaxID=3095358 RepID=UPI002A7503E7|nr:DUF5715 family protein [Patulibacter sp. DM4]